MDTLFDFIFNRVSDDSFKLPSDNWFHLVPIGEHLHKDSGVVQVIDDKSIDSMIASFNRESTNPNFTGLLVDFEHKSYIANGDSTAAAWVVKLEKRDTGIWGQLRWTDTGLRSVANGQYRMASPVFLKADAEVIDQNKMRPLRLDSVGLTNRANLKGVMVPLTNRESSHDDNGQTTKGKIMNPLLLAKLKLPATADETAIVTAVEVILNENNDQAKKIITLDSRVKELETKQVETEVNALVEKYSNRFNIGMKPKVKEMLLANRDNTIAFLEELPVIDGKKVEKGILHNRENGKTPNENNGELTEQQKQALRNKYIAEYKNSTNCSNADAVLGAASAHPELFVIERN